MEPKTEAAVRMVKQMGLTIKASGLYPPSHPGNALAVETLHRVLSAFIQTYGPFSVGVGRHTLSVDGTTVPGLASEALAYALYSRRLIQFAFLPTISESQLASFVRIVGMERTKLEAAGGIGRLLSESGVTEIKVKELTMGPGQEVVVLGQDAFLSLVGRGKLSPEERERVIETLTAGPTEASRLLQGAYTLAVEAVDRVTEDAQLQQVLQATKSVDRLILNEPFDQQGALYTNLAEALLLLDKPLGPSLVRNLLSKAGEDITAQVILEHLSSEHLAKIVLQSLAEGDAVQQIARTMRVWNLDQEKAKDVLSLLELHLRDQDGGGRALRDTVQRELGPLPSAAAETPPPVEFDDSRVAVSDEELKGCLREAQTIDEAASIREVVKTLVDVLSNATEHGVQVDVAEALAGYLSGLMDRREFAFLREVLGRVKALESIAGPERAEAIRSLRQRIAEGPAVDGLVAALWEARTTPAEQEIKACIEVLADELVGPLIRKLGDEPRAGVRAMLRDLLVSIGAKHVDEVGASITDSRWYLVRNVADILGMIRSPEGVPHLERLVRHWDVRVRMHTLDALARIGTDPAQAALSAFLSDREERVRLRALRALDARGLPNAMPALQALLEGRDPANRSFALRQAGIETAARLRARDALPALKKLARTRLIFQRHGRELRKLAREAIASIEGQPAP